MSTDEWYYVDDDSQQVGPSTIPELRTLFKQKVVDDDTFLWKEGQPEWLALADIPHLKAKLKPPPPPVPVKKPSIPSRPPIPPKPVQAPPTSPAAPQQIKAIRRNSAGSGRSMARASAQTNWVEKVTIDGARYYYNPSTESVAWDKPDVLKSSVELEKDSGEWVWVSDPDLVWVPARVLSRSGEDATVQLQSGQRRTIDTKNKDEPMWPLLLSSLGHIEDDLVMMDALNQGLLMHAIGERYRNDDIYTWVGANHSVLVSVNPFKTLPIYTVNSMEEYSKPSPNKPPPPHTFAIANSAYMKMKLCLKNQSILISGESGAGKTEATKQCLSFLAEVAGSESNVEQKILNANPVLEAFGNAKTLRNNNSSRFGRWMEIHFEERGSICGCRIENYLLEKARVSFQTQGERSYHIFYQLCFSGVGARFGVSNPSNYRYLNQSGCETVRGIDDTADFNDVCLALSQLGFAEKEMDELFGLVCAVLHLGNVTFKSDGDQGSVVDPGCAALQDAATQLKVDVGVLATVLCERSIEVRGEKNRILHKPEEALEASDSLAKAVYNFLFDWLVKRINSSVEGKKGLFIGVLDIFGFEIFKKNSFEQLCINFTNEKLQQHFNTNTFKEEESVYVSEGIKFEKVPFIDNQPVLDLIEKKPVGLLVLLDEEIRLPKGNDAKWLEKCDNNHTSHQCWLSEKSARMRMDKSSFTVRHYAGDVEYDSTKFYDKNKDALFRDLYDMMTSSTNGIAKAIFPPKDKNPRKIVSISGQFRSQLNALMQIVNKTEPYYIRCVKPNDEKRANMFDTKMSLEQLTYAGVFEAVKIRKSGFPFRLLHRAFVARYRCLAKGRTTIPVKGGDDRELAQNIMGCLPQDFSNVQIGNTMVLYRAEEHRILELLRNLALELIVPVAQRGSRRGLGRKYLRKLREAKKVCKDAVALGNDAAALDRAIKKVNDLLGPMRKLFSHEPKELTEAKELRHKLQERVELTKIMGDLIGKDPMSVYPELGCAIVRANKIKDIVGTAAEMEIEGKCREMLKSCAGPRIDPLAEEALWLLKREAMVDVLAQADEVGYTSADIDEIRTKLALSEEAFVKLQLKKANELNDPDRVINREIKLKELYLDAYGSMFTLDKFSLLRDSDEWASMKLFGFAFKKDQIAASFLYHSSSPIHASLTNLESPLSKEAVKMFKNIMGYMGDRKYPYPDTLAQEVIACGLANEALRAELYVQVMKQLQENPSFASETKGWELMSLLLSVFPPPPSVENVLSMFLREHCSSDKQEKYTQSLHMIIYGGARRKAMSMSEIPHMVANFFNKPITERYQAEDFVGVASRFGGGGEAEVAPVKPTPPPKANGAAKPAPPPKPAGTKRPPPPPPPPTPASNTATTLFDYLPGTQEGMLNLKKGDVVEVLNKDDSEWWLVEKGGLEGWVPAQYVKMN
ncbi:hypothetical protein TrLO_g13461 [Triparma laevis f. longispina]|uniref:Uncharacterized protein n=1 Tax=Triparma laevis f. longispina TaxID=1714387 RepID=A0A9W7E383_9STRA|nr:hypothetical protein TrLO_g13461 [Triparma laevis f. longispina]